MDQVQNELQQVLDHSFNLAQQMLNDDGTYDPFGVIIDSEKELLVLAHEKEQSIGLDAEQMMGELEAALEEKLKANEISSFVLCCDVEVAVNEDGDTSHAVMVDFTHAEDKMVPYYFFPYDLVNGKAKFGESFGIEK